MHDEIKITWDVPSKPNGEITHYIVRVTKDEFMINHRDYCSESMLHMSWLVAFYNLNSLYYRQYCQRATTGCVYCHHRVDRWLLADEWHQ